MKLYSGESEDREQYIETRHRHVHNEGDGRKLQGKATVFTHNIRKHFASVAKLCWPADWKVILPDAWLSS